MIDCTILLPDRAAFLAEVVEARGEKVGKLVEDLVEVKKEKKKEEAFVTALKVEGLEVEDLADVEVATFPAAEGDGDLPTDGVGEGAPPATLGGGQPPGGGGPPDLGTNLADMEVATFPAAEGDGAPPATTHWDVHKRLLLIILTLRIAVHLTLIIAHQVRSGMLGSTSSASSSASFRVSIPFVDRPRSGGPPPLGS